MTAVVRRHRDHPRKEKVVHNTINSEFCCPNLQSSMKPSFWIETNHGWSLTYSDNLESTPLVNI
jgi:hypothetical protein